jgi:hypothetical protein
MIRNLNHIVLSALIAPSILAMSGCSVFISTPRVAHFQVQRLDDKFIEYVVNLDDPTETDLDIHINNRYAIQLDFEFLWDSEDESSSEIYVESYTDPADPMLVPWMLCKYRF